MAKNGNLEVLFTRNCYQTSPVIRKHRRLAYRFAWMHPETIYRSSKDDLYASYPWYEGETETGRKLVYKNEIVKKNGINIAREGQDNSKIKFIIQDGSCLLKNDVCVIFGALNSLKITSTNK